MKQVASKATHLPKAQVYIEKQEATARQLTEQSEPTGGKTRITSVGP
jgi:hypothetical protein